MNQVDRLLTIVQRLRDPEDGCLWDKEQTFTTIAPYTLEGTYEMLDAIAREGFDDLHGELGDLLSQMVFYAQTTQEEGCSDFNDICTVISGKLKHRRLHVFIDNSAESSSEVLVRWERIKTGGCTQETQHSTLDGVPRSLPALMRTQKIQKRCANVGFDQATLGPVVDRVYEEIDEMIYEARQAVADQAKLEEEMGDLLLTTVNLTRHLGTKVEIALRKTNEKFERRSREVECIVAARRLGMTGVDLETVEEVWRQVERQETDL